MLLISQQRGYSKIPSLTKSHPILSVHCPLITLSLSFHPKKTSSPKFLVCVACDFAAFLPGPGAPKVGPGADPD